MVEKKASAPLSMDRVPFGIPELDKMLSGGLMPRRPYLIVGPAGTGKTSLALQFLCEGIRRGESVLYVTLEDPPNEIRLNHRSLRPELDKIDVFDAIPDVMRYERIPFKDISSVRDVVPFAQVTEDIRQTPEFTSTEVTIAALEQFLRTQTYQRGYTRMVIDSLTALQYFCMKGLDPVLGAQTFLRFLSDLRVTSVLTVESPVEGAETPERMLARGEIRMFRWERDGLTVRAIGVEKFRGSSHDSRMHPYRIGPRGIDINLSVTVSRDTLGIAEPVVRLVVPPEPSTPPEPGGPVGKEPTLGDEVADLIQLGVDVSPLRPEVEQALDQASAGHVEETAEHLASLRSLADSLARAALIAHAAVSGKTALDSEVLKRVSGRVDRARLGAPASAVPLTAAVREDLDAVLGMLPPAGPSSEAAPSAGPRSPLVTPPSAPATPPSEPSRAPPAPVDAALVVGGGAPEPSSPSPSEAAVAAAPELPPDRPARPRRRAAPGHGIVEPPPLPSDEPSVDAARAPLARPAPESPSALAPGSSATTPTLPPPWPEPLPPPVDGEPSAPSAEPAKSPPKRRRRTSTTSRAAAAAAAGESGEAGTTKPRRRVVRRKKAPPVVSAAAEPLPPASEETTSPPAPEAPAPPPPSTGGA